jgi:hypothetical protein
VSLAVHYCTDVQFAVVDGDSWSAV